MVNVNIHRMCSHTDEYVHLTIKIFKLTVTYTLYFSLKLLRIETAKPRWSPGVKVNNGQYKQQT